MRRLLTLLLIGPCWAQSIPFPDISRQALRPLLGGRKVVILDCNGTDSYQSGHLPGAIDYMENHPRIASLLPKDKNTLVVSYCGGAQCPMYRLGAEAVYKLGYHNVRHLEGGLQGWKQAGFPLEK